MKPQSGSSESAGSAPKEFDKHSADYVATLSHPLRNLLESNGENEFLRFKAKWLKAWMQRFPDHKFRNLLDFGCGTGLLIKYLDNLNLDLELYGTDVSNGMLEQAKKNLPHTPLQQLSEQRPFENKEFDLIVVSGVLHHIPLEEWPKSFAMLKSLVSQNGSIIVFEHNPWNPITQWVVRTTPVDQDAKMQNIFAVKEAFQQAQFEIGGHEYLHFFPPKWTIMHPIERRLKSCPLGSQYVIWAKN